MQVRLCLPLLLPLLSFLGCDNGQTGMNHPGRDGSSPDGATVGGPCDTDDDCDEEEVLRACRNHVCSDPGCPAGMTYVGSGAFYAGCDKTDKDCRTDSQPLHQVTLTKPFCISRTELSVAQYRACVKAGHCPASADLLCTNNATWTQAQGQNEQLPVNCLFYSEAQAACAFAAGRLPTEAEWEKAARGRDKRKYPWGNATPVDCQHGVNWAGPSACDQQPWPTGSGKGTFAMSASAALDMAGNVWEWTADWYDAGAYAACGDSCTDPTGPQTGFVRVRRGGSFASMLPELRASYREFHTPEAARSDMVGARCAAPAPQ